MEILLEHKICEKDLKIILYEDFQFELGDRLYRIKLIDLDCMKEIINTYNYALKYLNQYDFGIEQLGHSEGNRYKQNYYIYNQGGRPHRIGFYCCNKKVILTFNIGNSYRIEWFTFSDGSGSTNRIHISQSCFLKLNKILINIYEKMIELKNKEPERKKALETKVKKTLIKLSYVFEELTFKEIALKVGHTSPQKIEEIRKIVEDLLFDGALNARIRENNLVFGKPMTVKAVNMLGDIKDDTGRIKENTSQLGILKDIKADTELIKEYTSQLEDLLENIEAIELYLKEHLASDYEKLKNSFKEHKLGKISRKELAKRIAKIIGKNALKILISKILF